MIARIFGLALIAGAAYFWWSNRFAMGATGGGAIPEPDIGSTPVQTSPESIQGIVERVVASEGQGIVTVPDVLAIIQIESSFDPSAYRAEPQLDDASRGLMQILYKSAQDRGYRGAPDGLYDPATNILYGVRHLVWGYRYLDSKLPGAGVGLDQWVGAYNAGVGNVLKGRIPVSYVQKFRNARAQWS